MSLHGRPGAKLTDSAARLGTPVAWWLRSISLAVGPDELPLPPEDGPEPPPGPPPPFRSCLLNSCPSLMCICVVSPFFKSRIITCFVFGKGRGRGRSLRCDIYFCLPSVSQSSSAIQGRFIDGGCVFFPLLGSLQGFERTTISTHARSFSHLQSLANPS